MTEKKPQQKKKRPVAADVVRTDRGVPIASWYIGRIVSSALSVPPLGHRDRAKSLAEFARSEPFLAGALYTVSVRNSNFRWKITGPTQDVAVANRILENAWYGRGWNAFITALSYSFLTSDNGAWFEIVREYKTKSGLPVLKTDMGYISPEGEMVDPEDVVVIPASLPQQLIPLDPLRCFPTGDPLAPLEYEKADGSVVKLEWWQCAGIIDQPIPGRPYGFCAVSRVIAATRFMLGFTTLNTERVLGTTSRELVLTNVDSRAIRRAMEEASRGAVIEGNAVYSPPVYVSTLDPSATPAAIKLAFKDLPERFTLREFTEWYVMALSLALGEDYAFFAPLPGSRLGTATEAEVMARMARMKFGGYFCGMLAHIMNTKGILPRTVRFSFLAADYTEEKAAAEAAYIRAKERAARIESGEITPAIARQIASDAGDLQEEYLKLVGEENVLNEFR